MFKCELCGKDSKRHEASSRFVMETRKKSYPNGGAGWEIAKEVMAHTECVQKVKDSLEPVV